jgi:hypothetical protein
MQTATGIASTGVKWSAIAATNENRIKFFVALDLINLKNRKKINTNRNV